MIFNMSTGGASTADKVKYNNTGSGLQSTDVQGAIDEVNSSLSDVSTNLQNIQEAMTSLGNGNIEIELDHDDYHGYFIIIVDTEKRIKFVFGEKAGTEVRAY